VQGPATEYADVPQIFRIDEHVSLAVVISEKEQNEFPGRIFVEISNGIDAPVAVFVLELDSEIAAHVFLTSAACPFLRSTIARISSPTGLRISSRERQLIRPRIPSPFFSMNSGVQNSEKGCVLFGMFFLLPFIYGFSGFCFFFDALPAIVHAVVERTFYNGRSTEDN
jgi:hypothetical protein